MTPEERQKFFNTNRTSIIDYPKGIPEIEKYLLNPVKPGSPEPVDMIIENYKSMTRVMD